jgi:hypothetical protein
MRTSGRLGIAALSGWVCIGCFSSAAEKTVSSAQVGTSPIQTVTPRRVIGLVELPGLFGVSDPRGLPGQVPAAEPAPVRVFAAPLDDSPLLVVNDPEKLQVAEHAYEETSAIAYAQQNGWYEIGLSLEQLIADGGYVTLQWDRVLRDAPTQASGPRLIPGTPEQISDIVQQDERARSFWPGQEPRAFTVLEAQKIGDELWLRIDLKTGRCEVAVPETVASGWIPAYSPSGLLNVWFHSRGC